MKLISRYIVIIPLLLMALFSIGEYSGVANLSCEFQSFWFFCSKKAFLSGRIFAYFYSLLIFSLLILSSYFLWFKTGKATKALAVIGIFLSLLILPFGSADVSYYFSAGKFVSSGKNIYSAEWPRKTYFLEGLTDGDVTGFQYGPISAGLFKAIYDLSSDSIVRFMVIWKLFVLLCYFGVGYLTMKIIGLLRPDFDNNQIFSWWALQPLVLFEWVINGHFDGFWLIFLLLAILFAIKNKWWAVFPALAIGVWIKFIPIFFTPVFIVWWLQGVDLKNYKNKITEFVFGLLISLGITYLVWSGYWEGFIVFKSLILQSKWAVMSLFASIYYSLYPLFNYFLHGSTHFYLTRLVQGSLLIFALYLLKPIIISFFRVIFKKVVLRPEGYISVIFAVAMVYLLVWQKSVWPWYFVWLLPFGLMFHAFYPELMTKKFMFWLSATPLVYYIFWYYNFITFGTDDYGAVWFSDAVVIVIFLPLIYQLFKISRRGFNLETE